MGNNSNMEPRIVEITERKLIGMRIMTSLSENRTRDLQQRFKPEIMKFSGRLSYDFYSVPFVDDGITYATMTPHTVFEKWAAVEVADFDNLPEGMERLTLTGGLYAVFVHKGLPSTFRETADLIYRRWMPRSAFEVDSRAHFEIMSEKYRADDPSAEEDICVPIRRI